MLTLLADHPQVPFYYQEISTLLLRHCPDSFSGREGTSSTPPPDKILWWLTPDLQGTCVSS